MPITATERAHEINANIILATLGEVQFLLVTDAAHWAESGVVTGEELDQYLAWTAWAETHKEVRGFRPRGTDFKAETTQQWEARTLALRVEDAEEETRATLNGGFSPPDAASFNDASSLTFNPFAALAGLAGLP